MRNVGFVVPDEWFMVEVQLYKQGLVWAKELIKELKPLLLKTEITLDIYISLPELVKSYKTLLISSQSENDQIILQILNTTRSHIIEQHQI